MKRMYLAALTGALAISTMAVAIDVASAATRGGVYRGGVNRVGVGRVGVNRVGVGRVGVNRVGVGRVGIGYGRAGIGYGRAGIGYGRALAYRGGLNGYYRPGLGVAAGVALGAAAAAGRYYGDGSYRDSYARALPTEPLTMTRGAMSTSCAAPPSAKRKPSHIAPRRFRSYDLESRTFLAYSGERVSCPAIGQDHSRRCNIRRGIGRHDDHVVLCCRSRENRDPRGFLTR